MNVPPELLTRLQTAFFEETLGSQRVDDAISIVGHFARQVSSGLGLGFVGCVALVAVIVFWYRPRLVRGAFWLPAFGLFGGTPTLYMHTRPSSFCGVVQHTRRLRKRGLLERVLSRR